MREREMAGGDEVCPAKGGDGPTSYAMNSTEQRASVDAAKELVNKAIEEKFDLEILLASNTGTFRMADLGCSTGPNTFSAVESILEAVKLNSQVTKDLEFQVFFNDLTSNDFNMLFKSLPLNREYYAAGVPGSFYGRLFPNNSLHLVYSSSSIPWLSRVPKAVEDISSPAWNKGKIQYSHSSDEAIRAFEAQYGADMESFLTARAEEIVYGGLMMLVVPGRPDGTRHSECSVNVLFHLLGSCLMEMATKGLIDEEMMDGFNMPLYYMSPQELKAAVELNGSFSIESMEILPRPSTTDTVTPETAQLIASHIRAATEGLFQRKFGDEILDELYCLFVSKFHERPSIYDPLMAITFLLVLKRHAN